MMKILMTVYGLTAEQAAARLPADDLILKMPHQQVGEVNLVDEMVDRLLDILADKLTERLSAGHKELYTAKELAERYGVSCATIRSKMAAGEFGELVSVGESNAACTGYCLLAMQRAGLDEKTIEKVLHELHWAFDDTSVEQAEKIYCGGEE